MKPTYYQIELSARWLTVLLVILALLLVVAFVFGYGAAWSVLSAQPASVSPVVAPVKPTATPTPEVETVTVAPVATAKVSREQPTRAPTPVQAAPRATQPRPTARSAPVEPTPSPAQGAFWVQVLAVSDRTAIDKARDSLEGIGFPRDHQRVVEQGGAGGARLLKLRIGPLPDRASADRVAQRMRTAGFTGAWVVAP